MKKANDYTINHVAGTITIAKKFAKAAGTIGSQEYKTMIQLKKDFLNYEIKYKETRAKADKKTHKGLTIELMEKYIVHINDESGLAELEAVKEYYNSNKAYYAKVKAWFLKKYENYADVDFTITEESKRLEAVSA